MRPPDVRLEVSVTAAITVMTMSAGLLLFGLLGWALRKNLPNL